MKRRIVWLIDSLSPGGAEQLMPSVLINFDKEEFEIRVCTLQIKRGNPISAELRKLGIPVDLVPIYNLKNPFIIFRIIKYLRSHSPDLIHTQLEFSDILGTIAANILLKPSVSTLHTLDLAMNHKFSAPRQKLKWFVLKHFCNQIIAVSEKTREHHIQYGRLPQGKIKTIYNGIELARFQKHNPGHLEEKKRSLNIPAHHKIITTIAVLRELKGIQYMIKALPKIIEQNPDTTYLIVGNGDYDASLRVQIGDHQLNGHVVMTGHRTDIPDIFSLSDLFVLPSLGDALPTVLIEALAAGMPIVATEVGGIPEIIDHDRNGILVPPADPQKLAEACLRLIRSEEDARRLSGEGLMTASKRFDVSSQVQQLGDTYTQLIGRMR